jgi:mannose-1-phosphate guanylyltransferase
MLEKAYAVIMAGGRGERFWPLSTARRPKQLLALVGGKTLLAQAVDRLQGLLPVERVLVITSADLVEPTLLAAPALRRANVIGEPFGRDTAAACALGGALVEARCQDGVFCILTADQIMGDLDKFRATLRESLMLAAEADCIITIGIPPTGPSTAFGYIEAGEQLPSRGSVEFLKAKRFVEKPDRKTAQQYLASGKFFWNSGMFIWSVATLRRALAQHRPQLLPMADRMREQAGKPGFAEALREEYGRLEKISVDYAIMEKADNMVMVKGAFAWDDVGSWTALANHVAADESGNTILGKCEALDSRGNVVVSQSRLTALIGVQDLVVVQAEGVTLVCPKNRAEEVKRLVQHMQKSGLYGELL